MKRFFTLFILYSLCIEGFGFGSFEGFPKRETRAVWIATIGGIDWPRSYAQGTERSIEKQKDELRTILDRLQAAGMNTVLLQTRVRGTTIYPSRYEPWDGCLSGKPGVSPGYDALQFAIDECHRRGMELHAWVVTIPVGKWDALGCKQLRKRYPKLIKKIGPDGYMNPEDPATARVLADICDEIVEKYDVDGIHLDYIRYPEDWRLAVSRQKGRENITRIAKAISLKVKARKPWVKMSCSPIGKADDLPRQSSRGWNAYTRVCQDAQGWLRDGIMDQLYPMMYFKGQNFYPFLFDWKERSYGREVVPGLAIYSMSPKEQDWDLTTITQEMHVARQLGMGHCMFRSRFFTDNTKGIYDFTTTVFNLTLALPPAIPNAARQPLAPENLTVDSLNSTLSWSGDPSSAVTYNIYSSREWPVDISDSRNLMRIRLDARSCLAPLCGAFYAVTAMDRYGNESEPLQMPAPPTPTLPKPATSTNSGIPLVPCDGNTLQISERLKKTDLIQIKTLQGQTVQTSLWARYVNVENLPEGTYQIFLFGKNNAQHRIGYFSIKPRKKSTEQM